MELKVIRETIQAGIEFKSSFYIQSSTVFPARIVINTNFPYSKYYFSNFFKNVITR